jgi:phospholipase C
VIISIVNRSAKISDEELQCVIRAVNRQIAEDFEPYWSFGARLRLEGAIGRKSRRETPSELRGDAILYIADKADVKEAKGYHDSNALGIPYGFVFKEVSDALNEHWSVTLSHEALEMVGDAQGNLLVQGPHPEKPGVEVFHWFEMCDAVQSQTYKIDGIEVANFVLPLYFTLEEQKGGRNDFLGRLVKGKALASFGAAPGGYIGFFNPRTREHEQWWAPDDAQAQKRLAVKGAAKYGRGFRRQRSRAVTTPEMVQRKLVGVQGSAKAMAAAMAAPAPAPAEDPIKHVVVLMMENRSFDHMLGGMSAIDPQVEGVNVKKPWSNKGTDGKAYKQQPIAAWVVEHDLDHEHDGTLAELGTSANPMSGFISTHQKRYPAATKAELDQVMAYFPFGKTPRDDALPVLHGLARNFAVCDHWFSSMPGPTWQNRFFVHSGTCLGHTRMPSMEDPLAMRLYYQETIFDRLSEARIPWKIFHDGIPQSIVLTRLLTRYLTFRGYDGMDAFFEAAKGDAAEFPQYSFIEPRYFGAQENDQHPPADVRRGEQLIADVYNAIRANPELWNSTLLVVTCDEHGGFYDHVEPPKSVAPDGHVAEWSFDRLGVRVPTILVSPWVGKGVIKTDFDHTSLLRYLCDKWKLEPLGERAQRANSFADELQRLRQPRTDTPEKLVAASIPTPPRAAAAAAAAAKAPPITGSREALLLYVDQLPEPGGRAPIRAAAMGRRAGAAAKRMPPTPAVAVAAAEDKLERLRTKPTGSAPARKKTRARAKLV